MMINRNYKALFVANIVLLILFVVTLVLYLVLSPSNAATAMSSSSLSTIYSGSTLSAQSALQARPLSRPGGVASQQYDSRIKLKSRVSTTQKHLQNPMGSVRSSSSDSGVELIMPAEELFDILNDRHLTQIYYDQPYDFGALKARVEREDRFFFQLINLYSAPGLTRTGKNSLLDIVGNLEHQAKSGFIAALFQSGQLESVSDAYKLFG